MLNTGDLIFQIMIFLFLFAVISGAIYLVKTMTSQIKRSKRIEEKMDRILEDRDDR
ncbi:DUF4083 family protein [Metabacillus idriensis]|uniref:DUF4083 domain-containing protein n=1 Tax=Metabacillus idriensis TaxID=324768 RepID=A0A6I2MGW0_9BACI|nr:DUF4083 family protein [Metabacillus idriensis]MCM3597892.1 DUF4083 family protein [Metabacillus idriensis]MRX56377.1 DUF4083 domain-containing protein [Metabacillus idriensis]